MIAFAFPSNRSVSGVVPQQQTHESAWVVWETGIPIQDLSQQADGLWAGGYKGGPFRWDLSGGPLAAFSVQNGLPGNDVLAQAGDGSGGRWVALMDGGLAYSTDGQTYARVILPELRYGHAWDLAVHADTLWLATLGDGVLRKQGATWSHYTKANSGLPHNDVYAVAVESDGTAWFGTLGYGVAALRGATWTSAHRC